MTNLTSVLAKGALLAALVLSLLLAACSLTTAVLPTPTPTPDAPATATAAVVHIVGTAHAQQTATVDARTQVRATANAQQTELAAVHATATAQAIEPWSSTPLPAPADPISVNNVDRLTEWARFGKGWITQLAWSPDGHLLAVGTSIGVYLYDAETWSELHYLATLHSPAHGIAFSADGALVAAADGLDVRVWDVATGQEARLLSGPTDQVNAVAFSPTGPLLASGSADETVHLWNAETGELIRVTGGYTNGVNSLSFSPDGASLAIGGCGEMEYGCLGLLIVEEVETGQEHWRNEWLYSDLDDLAFSPDSALLATAQGPRLWVWDAKTGERVREFEGLDWATSVSFSPDSTRLAAGAEMIGEPGTGNWVGEVSVWQVQTGQLVWSHSNYSHPVQAVAFSPDGTLLASGAEDGQVRLVDPATAQVKNALPGFITAMNGVDISPDGHLVAGGSNDRAVYWWNLRTGQARPPLRGSDDIVLAVAFSPDGQEIVAGTYDKGISRWKLETAYFHAMQTLDSQWAFSVDDADFSPDGAFLVVAQVKARVWDLQLEQEIRTVDYGQEGVFSVAFSPDASLTAAGTSHGVVHLSSLETRRQVRQLDTGEGLVRSIDFFPGGTRLLTAACWTGPSGGGIYTCDIGRITVWDLATGQEVWRYQNDTPAPWRAVLTPDGSLVAVAMMDGSVRLLDAATGEELAVLYGHTMRVNDVAFSADGTLLVSGAADGTVRVWGVGAE